MTEVTALEREVLHALLMPLAGSETTVDAILESLVIKDRSFSSDALDKERCCGFYTKFSENTLLRGISNVPHHVSIQAAHVEIPTGADFILFFSASRDGLDFLEASFFGSTVKTAEVLQRGHRFDLRKL